MDEYLWIKKMPIRDGEAPGAASPIRVRMALRQLVYRRYRDAAGNGQAAKADAVVRQGRNLRKGSLPQWWLEMLDRDGLR
jgi:hypothetical protein